MSKLCLKKGATLLLTGLLTLPTSGWTGRLAMFDTRPGRGMTPSDFGIAVVVTAIGVNPQDGTKTDYAIQLMAPASTTAAWSIDGPNDVMRLVGDLMLMDVAGQVVPTARRFEIEVRA